MESKQEPNQPHLTRGAVFSLPPIFVNTTKTTTYEISHLAHGPVPPHLPARRAGLAEHSAAAS
jgi:hypothetical protein